MINPYKRWQIGLKVGQLFPTKADLTCACGCGKKLTGRKTKWASSDCNNKAYYGIAIIKGNNGLIRSEIFKRDKGYCMKCGVYDEKWEADHIIPVVKGGGGCGLSNYQTLCPTCHKEKTKHQMKGQRKAISSQE